MINGPAGTMTRTTARAFAPPRCSLRSSVRPAGRRSDGREHPPRGSFPSVPDLIASMETDPAVGDANPKRLIWTATTVSSLERSTRP